MQEVLGLRGRARVGAFPRADGGTGFSQGIVSVGDSPRRSNVQFCPLVLHMRSPCFSVSQVRGSRPSPPALRGRSAGRTPRAL